MSAPNESERKQATNPGVDVRQIEQIGRHAVESMQSLRELLEARATALEQCRAALEEHRESLIHEVEQFENRETELCEQIDARNAAVELREKNCAESEGRVSNLTASNARQSELVAKQEAEWKKRTQELAERKSELSRIEQSLAEREGRREDQARELSRRQEQLAEDQAALAAEREAVSRERTERGQRETEMSQLCASLERKQGELDRREKEVSAMRKEWDQKMQGLESAQASLAELQRQLKQELNKTVDTKNELLPVFGLNGESDQDGKPNNGEIPKPLQKQARESVKRFQKLCRDARRRAIGN